MVFVSQREKHLWIAAGLCLLLIYLSAFVARPVANVLRDANLLRAAVLAIFLIACGLIGFALYRSRPGLPATMAAIGMGLVYLLVLAAVPMLPEEKLHFLEFGGVGGLIYLALEERRQRRLSAPRIPVGPGLGAVLLTGASGWLDEGLQALLPERYYDLRDVAFNVIAALLAVVSLAVINRCRHGTNTASRST